MGESTQTRSTTGAFLYLPFCQGSVRGSQYTCFLKETTAYIRFALDSDRDRTKKNDEQGTHRFVRRQRTKVTNHIIHRYANRERDTPIDTASIDFFGKEFLGLRVDDGVSEFTQIQNTGAGNALRYQSLQSEIDNLGGFLVFRADIAVCVVTSERAASPQWEPQPAFTYLSERSVTSSFSSSVATLSSSVSDMMTF